MHTLHPPARMESTRSLSGLVYFWGYDTRDSLPQMPT
jgi:hypothetical protein